MVSNRVLNEQRDEKTESNDQLMIAEVKSKPNTENSRLIFDLKNNKLKDEDILLIYYIIDTGRFKLGTGWREKIEIDNIKVWEEIQELNDTLSINYGNALRRLEMKNITEVSQTTGYNNPKEISLSENVKNELLNISDDLLEIIDKVVTKNKEINNF